MRICSRSDKHAILICDDRSPRLVEAARELRRCCYCVDFPTSCGQKTFGEVTMNSHHEKRITLYPDALSDVSALDKAHSCDPNSRVIYYISRIPVGALLHRQVNPDANYWYFQC
jgi:hypothetical protein